MTSEIKFINKVKIDNSISIDLETESLDDFTKKYLDKLNESFPKKSKILEEGKDLLTVYSKSDDGLIFMEEFLKFLENRDDEENLIQIYFDKIQKRVNNELEGLIKSKSKKTEELTVFYFKILNFSHENGFYNILAKILKMAKIFIFLNEKFISNYKLVNVFLKNFRLEETFSNNKVLNNQNDRICYQIISKKSVENGGKTSQRIFSDLLIECLQKDYEYLSIKLMKKCEGMIITEEIATEALKDRRFLFMNSFLDNSNITQISKFMSQESIFWEVINLIKNEKTIIEGIYYLTRIDSSLNLSKYQVRYLCDFFQILLKSKEKLEIFEKCLSPLVVCIIISNFFLILSKTNDTFGLKLKEVAENYRNFGLIIYKLNCTNYLIVKYTFTKCIYPLKVTLVEILFQNKHFFMEFLISESILKIIRSRWLCTHNYRSDIFISSTSYNFLVGNFQLKYNNENEEKYENRQLLDTKTFFKKKILTNFNIFKYIQKCNRESIIVDNHIYQFFTFTRSVSSKIMFSFLLYLVIFFYIFFSVGTFLDKSSFLDNADLKLLNLVIEKKIPSNYTNLNRDIINKQRISLEGIEYFGHQFATNYCLNIFDVDLGFSTVKTDYNNLCEVHFTKFIF